MYLQDEHQRDMEDVLVSRTLLDLSAIKELGDGLRTTMEMQRALADKVLPQPCELLSTLWHPCNVAFIFLFQVEAMKETFFSGLAGELAGLQETVMQGLSGLQAENDRMEDEIRQAQDRHQTVRAVNSDSQASP